MVTHYLFFSVLIVCLGVGSAQVGEGEAMDEDVLAYCFRYIHCDGGEEKYQEATKCYEILGEEIFLELLEIAKQASREAGDELVLPSNDPRVIIEEFCPKDHDRMKLIFDELIVSMVEEFTTICSTKGLEKKCSTYEQGLSCTITLMEKAAEDKKCNATGVFP